MTTQTQTQPRERILYLDILRILACVLVVTVHVSAQQIDSLPLSSAAYFVTNAFNCLGFLGVTLFVMISGALLLGSPADGIKKPVLGAVRFFALYYIWKMLYLIIDMAGAGTPFSLSAVKENILRPFLMKNAYYHLWFLPMIAILYLTVPIVKKAFAERKNCEYFLCIFFLVSLLFPTLFLYEFKFKYRFMDFFNAHDFSFFAGYLGYFVMGHYLNRFCSFSDSKKRWGLYALGAVGFALACVLGFFYSNQKGELMYAMNTPFTPMMFLFSSAVFIACKRLGERLKALPQNRKKLCSAAKCTFGVYLLHPAFLLLARAVGFVPSICFPLISIPLIVICVSALCGLFSFVLLKIPVLRRLIR